MADIDGNIKYEKEIFYNSKGLRTREVKTSNDGEKSYRKFHYDKNDYYIGYDGRLESGHSYGYAWEVDSSGNKVPHTQEHYSGLQVSDDYWTK